MGTIANDMNGGIRQWLIDAKTEDPDAQLVSVMFDHEHDVTNERVALKDVDLTSVTINPRGSTALNDAIIRGLSYIKKGEEALVLIVTDGYENASAEATKKDVEKRIAVLEKQGVKFEFLSANPSTFSDGSSYAGTQTQSFGANLSTAGTRHMSGQTMTYLSEQKAKTTKTWAKTDNKTS
jgi:hypothetical protein